MRFVSVNFPANLSGPPRCCLCSPFIPPLCLYLLTPPGRTGDKDDMKPTERKYICGSRCCSVTLHAPPAAVDRHPRKTVSASSKLPHPTSPSLLWFCWPGNWMRLSHRMNNKVFWIAGAVFLALDVGEWWNTSCSAHEEATPQKMCLVSMWRKSKRANDSAFPGMKL